jgi:hypothetical protein
MPHFLSPRARELVVVIGRKFKRACDLAGAVMTTAFGAGVGVIAGLQLRLPDAALTQSAKTGCYLPMSAGDRRDLDLWMLGIGVGIFMWGARDVELWFRRALHKTPDSRQ